MLSFSDRSIEEVAGALARQGVEASFLVPTKTGLEKSILDAIAPFRDYLRRRGVHDYSQQLQGPGSKRVVDAFLVEPHRLVESKASLYRPMTKDGDPRVWFSGLGKYSQPGNLLAVVEASGSLYVINGSRPDVWESLGRDGSPLRALISRISRASSSVAEELLQKLKAISRRGFIPAVRHGPTAVGATLEHALGIAANSSKKPDYRGIEIKATRKKRAGRPSNRVNLFSQVPDWSRSACKNGLDLMNAVGYVREGRRRLACTVGSAPNSQNLYLEVDAQSDLLKSNLVSSDRPQTVCVWGLDVLRARLQEKQAETFWVKAESRHRDHLEEFHYVEVEHTRSPLVSNLELLLATGKVTMDFTLKVRDSGASRDHGYLFKIWPDELDLLFPPSVIYPLVDGPGAG